MSFIKVVCACSFMLLCLNSQAQQLKVKVVSPGTLSSLVGDHKNNIVELTVSGNLNGSDLRLLREMCGSDVNQNATDGLLRKLDLRNAFFVSGGESYISTPSGEKNVTKNSSSIPDYLFLHCHLEEVLLPVRADTIGEYAFANSGLKQIKLPNRVYISTGAFSNDSLLEKVTFPQLTFAVMPRAFTRCDRLKQLLFNNLYYLAANSLTDMKALQNISVNGFLGHIDGWNTISNCPQLKSVDFVGPVLFTGGPKLLSNCNQVEYVTFHAPVLYTCFGASENCEAFMGYIVKDFVCYSAVPSYIRITPKNEWFHKSSYKKLNTFLLNLYHSESALPKDKQSFVVSRLAYHFYDVACMYSLEDDKKNAFKYLEAAIEDGYNDYDNMKVDSDLINLHADKRYTTLLQHVREVGDKLLILQNSPAYERTGKTEPRFTYALPTDSGLTAVRNYFNLDSIAGNGDEISRMKNLLYWLHDLITHDGSSNWPSCKFNAVSLYQITKSDKRGLNCRFMAEMLNEVYLAEGFKSRFLTCQSREYDTDNDCHVINVVWSRSLHKWVWMDPTFCAFVTDDKGLLLHPGEVRERLIKGLPLVLNEDANWNHKNKQTKENYLEHYMAKNLYVMSAYLDSRYETENAGGNQTSPIVTLVPKGFDYKNGTTTTDDAYFWQSPE